MLDLVGLALAAKLHVEGGQRERAVEELASLADDALRLRAELLEWMR
jgi:hypothetical protein